MIAAVSAFLAALRSADSSEREMMIDELREHVCFFCGSLDPKCECWLQEEPAPS